MNGNKNWKMSENKWKMRRNVLNEQGGCSRGEKGETNIGLEAFPEQIPPDVDLQRPKGFVFFRLVALTGSKM